MNITAINVSKRYGGVCPCTTFRSFGEITNFLANCRKDNTLAGYIFYILTENYEQLVFTGYQFREVYGKFYLSNHLGNEESDNNL